MPKRFWIRKALSPELNERFEQQYRNGGIAPTTFAIFLGLIATLALYLVAGFSNADNVGWYEGVQAQRLHRLAFISIFLIAVLGFWRFWNDRWAIVAFVASLIVFSIAPVSFFIMEEAARNEVIAWRGIGSQMTCIVLAFAFLRVPLRLLILTAVPSSLAVLSILFESNEQRLVASTMLTSMLLIGIAVWLTIYWRERRLFEQAVLIEAAAETERQYADLVRQERRSLIHDIRQPMSAFAIHMGILRTTQFLTPELQNKLSTLGFAFDALAGQVDEFARESERANESEFMAVSLESVDIVKSITNTVQLHEPLAASKSIALTAVYRPELINCVVRTNSVQLSNVLQLLVGNAIKFNHSSTVRVSCKFDRNSCSIHITDTGPGIESANLERIFDAGFSTGLADTNSQGLGLFNVRRIVTSLPDHHIRVRSNPGRYTSFKLTLPLAPTVSRVMNNLRMIVVDDEPSIASGLALLFKGSGAIVETACSAARAMDLVLESDLAFEVLVCDHDLGSGANGLDLIGQVRAYYGVQVPAILVTGRKAQIGRVANSVDVVSKPFDADMLLRLVERSVKSKVCTQRSG